MKSNNASHRVRTTGFARVPSNSFSFLSEWHTCCSVVRLGRTRSCSYYFFLYTWWSSQYFWLWIRNNFVSSSCLHQSDTVWTCYSVNIIITYITGCIVIYLSIKCILRCFMFTYIHPFSHCLPPFFPSHLFFSLVYSNTFLVLYYSIVSISECNSKHA
jgi:hypothetical protein